MLSNQKPAHPLPTRADTVALSQDRSAFPALSITLCFVPPSV